MKRKGLAVLPEWQDHFTVARRETGYDDPVVEPVFSGRACRHCGGPTVEGQPKRHIIGWSSGTLQRTPIYAGDRVRRRFWCDECEKVTS